MDVLDAAGRELDHFDGIGARDDEVSDVEADARLRPDQQPLDLLRALDRAAEPGLDRELEPVAGALRSGRKPGGPAVTAPSPTAAASESTRSASIWWPQSPDSLMPQQAGARASRCAERGRRPRSPPMPRTPRAITAGRLTF